MTTGADGQSGVRRNLDFSPARTESDGRSVEERLEAALRSLEEAQKEREIEAAKAKEFQTQLQQQAAQLQELQARMDNRHHVRVQERTPEATRAATSQPDLRNRCRSPTGSYASSTPRGPHDSLSRDPTYHPYSRSPKNYQQPHGRTPRHERPRPHSSSAMEEIFRRLDRIDNERQLPPTGPYASPISKFPRRQGPFVAHIRGTVRPTALKGPRLPPYTGDSDPMHHMDAFELAATGKGYSDGLMCLLFVETLGGAAASWFFGLEENSISSFIELRHTFLRRYKLVADSTLSIGQLFHEQQRPQEPLRAFLTRWFSSVSRCRDLDKRTALQAFKHCLAPTDFLFLLTHHHKNLTYDEVMDLASTYAEDEEETWGVGKTRPFQSTHHTVRDKSPERQDFSKGEKGDQQEHSRQFSRSKNWHKGARSAGQSSDGRPYRSAEDKHNRSASVHVIFDLPIDVLFDRYKHLIPPRAPRFPDKVKKTGGRWCEHHHDDSHNTIDCRGVHKELVTLFRAGKISPDARQADDPRQPPTNIPKTQYKQINTISGGDRVGAHLSNRARKHIARLNNARMIAAVHFDRGAKMPKEGWTPIVFDEEEGRSVRTPHSDPLVISAILDDQFQIQRVFIDNGSAVNIIYHQCYEKMDRTKPLYEGHCPLEGFSGETVMPLGSTHITVEVGESPYSAKVTTEFLVVDAFSPYNVILGRPAINQLGLIPFGRHMMIKFPTPHGTGIIRVCQETLKECMSIVAHERQLKSRNARCHAITSGQMTDEPIHDPRFADVRYSPTEPVDIDHSVRSFCLADDHPQRTVFIGVRLSDSVAHELEQLLREKADVFAWSYADMPGIDPAIMTHQLNIVPHSYPVRQRARLMDKTRADVVLEQVAKLQLQKFIRIVHYPTWLANPVLVAKPDGRWRMCIDYTNLNKACPKDSFPLPRIDALIDSTAGHALMSMMDAYSGYNQIRMDPKDEEATAFMTRQGLYCWQVMPFGLKNAGATYQRLMTKMFEPHLGKEVEIYVDDMVVKSKTEAGHVHHLRTVLDILLRHKMRLNPLKCYFGVTTSKFLGYIISERGIDANPEKVQAIMNMEQPRTKKEIQVLDGRLASLSRFIARLTDKCRPFFQCLSTHAKAITWTPECTKAFNDIKEYLANVPQLAVPVQGEPLYLYLAVSETAVSAALILSEGAYDKPVFYAGRAMVPAETRYPLLEQMALALITAARRLRNYFQAHTILIRTDTTLKLVLQNPDRSGRLSKWAVELSEFDIQFTPRTAYKGQAVADFLAEHTKTKSTENPPSLQQEHLWRLYVDGSSCAKSSGAGLVLESPTGETIEYALKFDFSATNNEAEYEALIAGLLLAKEHQVQHLLVLSDSQLVINQINGTFQVKDDTFSVYLEYVRMIQRRFQMIRFEQIPRAENVKADALARLATTQHTKSYSDIKVEHLAKPCRERTLAEVCMISEGSPCWMADIIHYKKDGILPANPVAARAMVRRAHKYFLMHDRLYRKGETHPHMRCVTIAEGKQILRTLHSGLCGNHTSFRALVNRILRTGYFWDTMKQDAEAYVRQCVPCQQFANVKRTPNTPLVSILSPWVHATWGLDLIGKLPTAKGQYKYVIVAVDYFTKWVEAEPLALIDTPRVARFLWRNIYCRYGVPHTIVTDNGAQFNNESLISFLRSKGTAVNFASVAHPQANGQVEAANKKIMQLLKKTLGAAKGLWADKLPEVLWALRTTPSFATGCTPFSLMFGSECVLPIEQAIPTARVELFDTVANDDARRMDLDLVEEERLSANIRNVQHKQKVARFYDARVREKQFYLGDLVMKKVIPPPAKFQPTWEGPYAIVQVLGQGAYKLSTQDGIELPRAWNAENLMHCYKN